MPVRERAKLDLAINSEPTYTDVMAFLAGRLIAPVHYLEIGVSAGKTFYQMARVMKHGQLASFDIEELNPTLATLLERADGASVVTKLADNARLNQEVAIVDDPVALWHKCFAT